MVAINGVQIQADSRRRKQLQLLISCALASGLFLFAVGMALASATRLHEIVSPLFWVGVAIGALTVAGSNVIYLRRLRRR